MKTAKILLGLAASLLAGCATVSESQTHGMFPCVWSENGFAFYPFYYHASSDVERESTWWAIFGMMGERSHRQRSAAHWAIPFYMKGFEDFYSFPYTYVGGERRGGTELYLAGLAGRRVREDGATEKHWMLPFYLRGRGMLATPLFGWTADSDWVTPIYYRGKDWTVCPFYAVKRNAEEGGVILPLALTYATWDRRGHSTVCTLPYGQIGGGTAQTNSWWATPIFGKHTGTREGWWLFPFYGCKADEKFDEKAKTVGGETVPDPVTFADETVIDSRGQSSTLRMQRGSVRSENEQTYLMLFDNDRQIEEKFSRPKRQYGNVIRRKVGNRVLFNAETVRETKYDCETRRRLADWETSEWSILWRLFRYESNSAGETAIDFLYVPVWR